MTTAYCRSIAVLLFWFFIAQAILCCRQRGSTSMPVVYRDNFSVSNRTHAPVNQINVVHE